MINLLEKIIGSKVKKKLLSMQLGDVKKTYADIDISKKDLNFQPRINLHEGLIKFVSWYKEYHKI